MRRGGSYSQPNMQQTTHQQTLIDCTNLTTREINQKLKALASENIAVKLLNPAGRHNLAVGITKRSYYPKNSSLCQRTAI